jgi:hypothetical protein
MNTTSNPVKSLIPSVFNTNVPTFSSKDEYLKFVSEWKLVYKHVSLLLKHQKVSFKLGHSNLRPEKVAHYTPINEALSALLKTTEKPVWLTLKADSFGLKTLPNYWMITPKNTGNPKTKARVVWYMEATASWLLWLRREAKKANRPAQLTTATIT